MKKNKIITIRLRWAMVQEGFDPEDDEFDTKDQIIVAVEKSISVAPTNNLELEQVYWL